MTLCHGANLKLGSLAIYLLNSFGQLKDRLRTPDVVVVALVHMCVCIKVCITSLAPLGH
jgi:hypothetical protein